MSEEANFISTGVEGLDDILNGGLIPNRVYHVQGDPGSGKTTLGLQCARAGVKAGRRVLYLANAESEHEITEIARSHGWSLDGISLTHHTAHEAQPGVEQTLFSSTEVELPRTIESILSIINEHEPSLMVLDSISELRALASERYLYRRQIAFLKEYFLERSCTVLLLDDQVRTDEAIVSMCSGAIVLDQTPRLYGPDMRRIRVVKMRGHSFATGYHSFRIKTGGIAVFPRLSVAESVESAKPEVFATGVDQLDTLAGGGLDRGASVLLMGPAGTGKSLTAMQCMVSAAERGERSVVYVFDERVQTTMHRAAGIGLDIADLHKKGLVELEQIDPTSTSPGEFGGMVREAVESRDVRIVALDSLNGYSQSMQDESSLLAHLHELVNFLAQRHVTSLLLETQRGFPGFPHETPLDMSYIADTVLLFRLFEHKAEIRKAVSVYKRRGGPHESTIRELTIRSTGIMIGEPLSEFTGVLKGEPTFHGAPIHENSKR